MSARLEAEGPYPEHSAMGIPGQNGIEVISINGSLDLPLRQVLTLAEYALTNVELLDDDPRLAFIEKVRSLHLVPGRTTQGKMFRPIPFDTTE